MATGPKGAVKHLVILVQENHTTNNYFRSLGAYGANVATDWPLAPGPSWRNEEHHRHDQTTSNQEHELRRAAERASWQVAKVYNDHGISGAKGRNGRPAFDMLCRDAAKRQFDVVMAWNVDRLGRSPERPSGVSVRASRARHRPVSASAGSRYDHAGRQGDVSDVGRLCRVRALDNSRARARWPTAGQA